jgi:hypothetical protein
MSFFRSCRQWAQRGQRASARPKPASMLIAASMALPSSLHHYSDLNDPFARLADLLGVRSQIASLTVREPLSSNRPSSRNAAKRSSFDRYPSDGSIGVLTMPRRGRRDGEKCHEHGTLRANAPGPKLVRLEGHSRTRLVHTTSIGQSKPMRALAGCRRLLDARRARLRKHLTLVRRIPRAFGPKAPDEWWVTRGGTLPEIP